MRSGGLRSSSLSNRDGVDASHKPLFSVHSPPLRMTQCWHLYTIGAHLYIFQYNLTIFQYIYLQYNHHYQQAYTLEGI